MSNSSKLRRALPIPLLNLARGVYNGVAIVRFGSALKAKRGYELGFWEQVLKREGGQFKNGHFEPLYTTHFGLSRDWYAGKKILDVGCGPRGSLEWAEMADERVGVDPLVEEYLRLGADQHAMSYVSAPIEAIPAGDGHFDVVTAFNALDHVEELDAAMASITRVLRPGGSFLLIVEVGHGKRVTEPVVLGWDFPETLDDRFEVLMRRHFEHGREGVYPSLREAVPFDHSSARSRPGILLAHLIKR